MLGLTRRLLGIFTGPDQTKFVRVLKPLNLSMMASASSGGCGGGSGGGSGSGAEALTPQGVQSFSDGGPLLKASQRHRGTISLKGRGVSDDEMLVFCRSMPGGPTRAGGIDDVPSFAQASGRRSQRELRALNLPQNALTDRGAHALAELIEATPSLRVCNLTHNNIGTEGVRALIKCAQRGDGLTALNLTGNPGWSAVGTEYHQLLGRALQALSLIHI